MFYLILTESSNAVTWPYLCALWTNYRKISHNPKQEVLQLGKVIRTDAPGLIDQKHNVCFHPSTHCDRFTGYNIQKILDSAYHSTHIKLVKDSSHSLKRKDEF